MSPVAAATIITSSSFPRVSGDEPVIGVVEENIPSFSPRERG